MKCGMMTFHQFTSEITCAEKHISQLKCSRISFLKIFLVPYAFTGCNLRVGNFDVFASNMNIFASIFHRAQVIGHWNRYKVFTTCASSDSWTTVIENPSNVKEICSRHGIQA